MQLRNSEVGPASPPTENLKSLLSFGSLTPEDLANIGEATCIFAKASFSLGVARKKSPTSTFHKSPAVNGLDAAVKPDQSIVLPPPDSSGDVEALKSLAHRYQSSVPVLNGDVHPANIGPTQLDDDNDDDGGARKVSEPPKAPQSWADLVRSPGSASSIFAPAPTFANISKRKVDEPKSSLRKLARGARRKGLINNGNMCFMNVVLQALAQFQQLYDTLHTLSKRKLLGTTETPLLTAMFQFLQDFTSAPPESPDTDDKSSPENTAIEPDYVFQAIQSKTGSHFSKGRQEDAEEFLGYLVNGLHDELSVVEQSAAAQDEDWKEVAGRGKVLQTQAVVVHDSTISRSIGGKIRSIIRPPWGKSSVTTQPFFSLQLDISSSKIQSIGDALISMCEPESIEFSHSTTTGGASKILSTKKTFIEKLPPILILHLKRFTFDRTHGVLKNKRYVEFSKSLSIPPALFASPSIPSHQLQYTLFAAVHHHGDGADGGHYTCDVEHSPGMWLHIDDADIKRCTVANVTEANSDRHAYMLFYVRQNLASECLW
ncbi:hypothetical protein DFS34DRAFT_651269 [Phlyctochytrium arcticum]|nr:hypothetical protein DFS34DRAFT_651269 [Phlyctochytrium arcticum]